MKADQSAVHHWRLKSFRGEKSEIWPQISTLSPLSPHCFEIQQHIGSLNHLLWVMSGLVLPKYGVVWSTELPNKGFIGGSLKKVHGKICLVIKNSTTHSSILLKFGIVVHYGSAEIAEWKSSSTRIYKMADVAQTGNGSLALTQLWIVWLFWNLIHWCTMSSGRPLYVSETVFRSNPRWRTAPILEVFKLL